MKKLLGLLGAAGLVATTSATVVACGDKEVTKTDLSKMELTVASGLTEKEAKESIAKQVTAKVKDAKETTDYTISVKAATKADEGETEEALADGTEITVAATKDSKLLTGTKTIKVGNSTPEVSKKDLKDLKVEITTTSNKEDAEKAISAAIVELAKGAVLDTDYTITYKAKAADADALNEGDTFTVTAVDASTLLTGSIVITVTAAAE
ncbi:lipoprotein [Spiroplasma endosymbiont of Dioctria linearis]|uniref:lipoprotein n=1 Tax=Spiroplasma endosymbiont of Dioctria linearis TaxID=3066290 RepID=UPI00313E8B68